MQIYLTQAFQRTTSQVFNKTFFVSHNQFLCTPKMTKITNAGGGLVIVTSVHKSKNKQKQ